MYKRLKNEFTGVITGKGLTWGGSVIRLKRLGMERFTSRLRCSKRARKEMKGKTCLVSGSGNVAQYTVDKLISLGAKAVTLSDSTGYIYDEAGIDREKLGYVMDLKNNRRGRIGQYADKFKGATFTPVDPKLDHNPLWIIKPSARSRVPPRMRLREGRGESSQERGLRCVGRREHADDDRWRKPVPQAGILFGRASR